MNGGAAPLTEATCFFSVKQVENVDTVVPTLPIPSVVFFNYTFTIHLP